MTTTERSCLRNDKGYFLAEILLAMLIVMISATVSINMMQGQASSSTRVAYGLSATHDLDDYINSVRVNVRSRGGLGNIVRTEVNTDSDTTSLSINFADAKKFKNILGVDPTKQINIMGTEFQLKQKATWLVLDSATNKVKYQTSGNFTIESLLGARLEIEIIKLDGDDATLTETKDSESPKNPITVRHVYIAK